MGWDNGAIIGFSATGNSYANHDPSSSAVACVNTPESDWSNVVYLLSNASPEDPAPRKLLSDTHVVACNWFLYIYAEDVTVSDIMSPSATITWTIASLSQQQQYYVDYGTDENALDQRSKTVISSDDTSLTDQNYTVSLSELFFNTTYYIQVVATFGVYTLKSGVSSFTTPKEGRITFTCCKLIYALSVKKLVLPCFTLCFSHICMTMRK